ncbi:MAG: tetratricopeptide repeat protein [Myxococcota bacterium]|nr:tetratricopeptide repeat protein [Myxococcota bacterium]
MNGRHRQLSKCLAVLLLCLPGAAAADIDKQLSSYESEAKAIASNLPNPNQPVAASGRRLVEGEVAFALGDYDNAALLLFDLATKPGADREPATYYLGESLYQKGDRGAARNYFAQVVATSNTSGKYYQPAVLRLIEISIAQGDSTDGDTHLAALDRLGAAQTAEAPYVRGKYLYSQGKHDEALAQFALVPKGSEHAAQAQYYTAATLVAKRDLARATELFTELTTRRPMSSNDRRVMELSQLALGRLHYELDQASKSIDAYLMVDRRSDLFPDALYEVAWVYVKSKQYDKALRALELLHASTPTSEKTPTVRILEGNLRIRKAQMVRSAQISGALDTKGEDPAVEYDKAAAVFAETHAAYVPSYQALSQMVGTSDPAQYLSQIAGRSTHVFQATAPIPEAAAQYLRDVPEVQRAVAVEQDLGEIQRNIRNAEATIARLEGVLAANDRTAVYPALASRRSRIGKLQDELVVLRSTIADQLGSTDSNRKALAAQYAAMTSPERAHGDAVAATQREYDVIEAQLGEVSTAIDSTQAMAVAIRKYKNDMALTPTPLAADQATSVTQVLEEATREAAAVEAELEESHRELTLGRDLAGVGDERVAQARELRRQLKAAQDAELRTLAGRGGKLVSQGERAGRLSEQLAQTESQIDSMAARGMEDATRLIAEERTSIASFKTELAELDAESRALGGAVLGNSFKDVLARFYDIVIRTDVGVVDVAWSQKEDSDDDLKRLNLSRQRELKQLRDEFKGIIDGGTKSPGAPAPTPIPGGEGPPAGSPDKGGGAGRVAPGSDKPTTPATPIVRPDNEQTPKGGPAPKGGTR